MEVCSCRMDSWGRDGRTTGDSRDATQQVHPESSEPECPSFRSGLGTISGIGATALPLDLRILHSPNSWWIPFVKQYSYCPLASRASLYRKKSMYVNSTTDAFHQAFDDRKMHPDLRLEIVPPADSASPTETMRGRFVTPENLCTAMIRLNPAPTKAGPGVHQETMHPQLQHRRIGSADHQERDSSSDSQTSPLSRGPCRHMCGGSTDPMKCLTRLDCSSSSTDGETAASIP